LLRCSPGYFGIEPQHAQQRQQLTYVHFQQQRLGLPLLVPLPERLVVPVRQQLFSLQQVARLPLLPLDQLQVLQRHRRQLLQRHRRQLSLLLLLQPLLLPLSLLPLSLLLPVLLERQNFVAG
jgi:hypothetical protein